MRIFFSMHHLGSFLVYEPVVRELAARGHDVHLAISRAETLGWERTLADVRSDHPRVTWSWLTPSPDSSGVWFEVARTIRIWAGYLRYFDPAYAATPRLKARSEEGVPPRLVRISNRPFLAAPSRRARLLKALRAIERALPPAPEIQRVLRDHRPDVVLITPLVFLGSWQFEVLRTALAEGLRTVFCVGSWDHLSSKALIRDMPHRVLVWNETQKAEATRLHRVPEERITVTGAQCYDQWFGRAPRRTRAEFCRLVGLPPDRPFILYVCSALFWGSPVEAEFVLEWIRRLRASAHAELRSAAVLVRPHPARMEEWDRTDLTPLDHVAIHGATPRDAESREDYFESLYFASAVVGLNTSAFIEASIVGRPVHTILTPGFHENQEGTPHFRYLLEVGGGVLQAARSFEEHHAHLLASLTRSPEGPWVNPEFVRAFVRPHGLDVPATPVVCDAVERMMQTPVPEPEAAPWHLPIVRALVYPTALVLQWLYGSEVLRDVERVRHKEQHRRARLADEHRRKAERAQARAEKVRLAEAARAAERRERDARLAESQRAKRERKAMRSRQKLQHQRAKRRALLIAQIKSRLGFGQ